MNKEKSKIDISKIIDLYNNDKAKVFKILNLYHDLLPSQIEEFSVAMSSGNLKNLNAMSHTLKTTFRYLGSVALSDYAKEVEMKSLDSNFDPKECDACLFLVESFESVMLQIKEYLIKYE